MTASQLIALLEKVPSESEILLVAENVGTGVERVVLSEMNHTVLILGVGEGMAAKEVEIK